MTTTEQESILSGGLEKEPIALKIELGVLRTSVTVSLSKWTSKSTISLRFYSSPFRPAISEGEENHNEYDEYEYDEPWETIESRNRKRITGELLERFKQAAVVRYIQAWDGIYKIDREYILRAVSGTSEFEKTLAGVFGAFNKKAFQKSEKGWEVIDFEKLYPEVRRLPQEGVERIRSVFQENKKGKD